MDVWSRLYLDFWRGDPHPFTLSRDDGASHTLDSAVFLFEAPRGETEERALGRVSGRVLDLGCGVGSYALYLQGRGLEVTAVDSSPGAIEVCRERGCAEALVMDMHDMPFAPRSFDSMICMGNTLGIGQSPDTLPGFLARLRAMVRSGGVLVAAVVDALATEDPSHVAYHERNRAMGRPQGLVRTRLRYRGQVSEWWDLWMPSNEELSAAAEEAGWRVQEMDGEGRERVVTLMNEEAEGKDA